MIVYLSGTYMQDNEATFAYNDRSIQFADSIYEVIHIYNGKCFELDAHLIRLQHGLDTVHIQYDVNTLYSVFEELIQRNNIDQEGMIYLQISRGAAARKHGLPEGLSPTVFAYADPIQPDRSYYHHGGRVVFYEDIRWHMCNIKTTGLLVNAMAKEYATQHKVLDVIFHRGEIVTEASASNVFMVKEGKLYTHPNGNRILPGITREVVIREAKYLEIPVVEEPFTKQELLEADEIFLTGTISEITPIVEVEGTKVGNGEPSEVTRRLQKRFEEVTEIMTMDRYSK